MGAEAGKRDFLGLGIRTVEAGQAIPTGLAPKRRDRTHKRSKTAVLPLTPRLQYFPLTGEDSSRITAETY